MEITGNLMVAKHSLRNSHSYAD